MKPEDQVVLIPMAPPPIIHADAEGNGPPNFVMVKNGQYVEAVVIDRARFTRLREAAARWAESNTDHGLEPHDLSPVTDLSGPVR